VNCHADQSRAGSFRLSRIPEGITISPKTGENLTAAMNQLSRERVGASPLLVYALTAHGGRTTPLLTRHSTAYQNLESWAASALASLPGQPVKSADVVAATYPGNPKATPANPPLVPPPATAAPTASKPIDPFDPAEFNKSVPKK
jgi:hypothetical protein